MRHFPFKPRLPGVWADGSDCRPRAPLLRAALESSKGNPEGAFDQTLCAAWVADDGSRPEQAKALRREANQYLVGRADWLVDLQLVWLDVLRRASNWQDAAALAAQLEADDLEYPLSAIVRFHSARIAVEDDSCHTIKEALDAAPVELPEGFREIPIIWED